MEGGRLATTIFHVGSSVGSDCTNTWVLKRYVLSTMLLSHPRAPFHIVDSVL